MTVVNRELLKATILQLIQANQEATPSEAARYHGVPSQAELARIKASRFPTIISGQQIQHLASCSQ
jgi:hypothetical protein